MTANRLIIEMALALLLATFAMSLDYVHATASQHPGAANTACQEGLPALAGIAAPTDNGLIAGRSISDESLGCAATADPVKVNNKKNDWLKLLP